MNHQLKSRLKSLEIAEWKSIEKPFITELFRKIVEAPCVKRQENKDHENILSFLFWEISLDKVKNYSTERFIEIMQELNEKSVTEQKEYIYMAYSAAAILLSCIHADCSNNELGFHYTINNICDAIDYLYRLHKEDSIIWDMLDRTNKMLCASCYR